VALEERLIERDIFDSYDTFAGFVFDDSIDE